MTNNKVVRNTEHCQISFWVVTRRLCTLWVGFTNRLCRLTPRTSRSKGPSSKVWYAQSQLPLLCMISSINKHSSTIYVFNFIHFIRFCVDNARVFQRVLMNLNMTVGKAACRLYCRILKALWLRPAYYRVNCVDCYVRIRRKVRNGPDQSFKIFLICFSKLQNFFDLRFYSVIQKSDCHWVHYLRKLVLLPC